MFVFPFHVHEIKASPLVIRYSLQFFRSVVNADVQVVVKRPMNALILGQGDGMAVITTFRKVQKIKAGDCCSVRASRVGDMD